ncbi:MAG: 50S ribosomal protein L6 [Candidatus Hadarchaeota archaeon]
MAIGVKNAINIPEGLQVQASGRSVEVSGARGKVSRTFRFSGVKIWLDEGKVVVEADSTNKASKAAVGTIIAHLKNMFKGARDGFTYKLKVVYSHFPITVKVDGKKVLIQNFIGERNPRSADIVGDVKVEVNGDEVLVKGADKEEAGQTAVNIERATRVTGKDRRVFQDGCYIMEVT